MCVAATAGLCYDICVLQPLLAYAMIYVCCSQHSLAILHTWSRPCNNLTSRPHIQLFADCALQQRRCGKVSTQHKAVLSVVATLANIVDVLSGMTNQRVFIIHISLVVYEAIY